MAKSKAKPKKKRKSPVATTGGWPHPKTPKKRKKGR